MCTWNMYEFHMHAGNGPITKQYEENNIATAKNYTARTATFLRHSNFIEKHL